MHHAVYKLLSSFVSRLAGLRTSEQRNALLESVPQLCQFVMKDAKLTGKELGRGAYGCVEEVQVYGATCAGKRIYETLIDPQNEGVNHTLQKYGEECRLLSSLNHPNIVQFLGIYFLKAQPGYSPSLPVLVMRPQPRRPAGEHPQHSPGPEVLHPARRGQGSGLPAQPQPSHHPQRPHREERAAQLGNGSQDNGHGQCSHRRFPTWRVG